MQWKLCGFGIEQTPTHILDILLHSFYLEVSIIKITEQRHEFKPFRYLQYVCFYYSGMPFSHFPRCSWLWVSACNCQRGKNNTYNLEPCHTNRQQTCNPALKSCCGRGWTSEQNGKITTAKLKTSIHTAISLSARFPSRHRPSRHGLITQFKKFNPLWPKVLWGFRKCFSLNTVPSLAPINNIRTVKRESRVCLMTIDHIH